MEYQFYTTDVFTDQVFGGAPILVFPAAEGLDDKTMLSLAREMRHLEAVFVFPPSNNETQGKLRVFGPLGERSYSIHTTVAAAHVLATIGAITLTDTHTPLAFEHNQGTVSVHVTQTPDSPLFTQVSVSSKPVIDHYVPSETELANILSLQVNDLENKKFSPMMVATERRYLIVPLRSFDAVRKARLNFKAWNQSSAPSSMVEEILLFSRETEQISANFHVRLIGPDIADHDDPAVGGVIPAFSAFLCAHEHIRKGTYIFAIERGCADDRQSILHVEMDNKGEQTLTVRTGGNATISVEGKAKTSG